MHEAVAAGASQFGWAFYLSRGVVIAYVIAQTIVAAEESQRRWPLCPLVRRRDSRRDDLRAPRRTSP